MGSNAFNRNYSLNRIEYCGKLSDFPITPVCPPDRQAVIDAAKAKAEAELKAKAEAELKAKAEAELKAKAEAELKAKKEAEAKAAVAKKIKKSTINCFKGNLTKKVTAVNPKCPKGYKKK
jgi:membrane protein involved in colicin uptake